MLPLAESTRIALTVREKLQAKHRAWLTVKGARQHHIASAKRGRCNHRIVLQIIRPRVGVAVIVGRWDVSSAALERNPELRVVVNGVAENGPAGVVATDADAVEAIERNDVALASGRAANRPVRRRSGGAHVDAAVAVAERHRARHVGADLVALDDETGRWKVTAELAD
jgi:hypothetical protein